MKKRLFFVTTLFVSILCISILIPQRQNSQQSGLAQAAEVASELGDVLSVQECEDEQGTYYIVESSAFGGSEVLVSDGEIVGVDTGENCVTELTEQQDFYGNTVTVPVDYQEDEDGNGIYFLSDFTRNIFTYNCSMSFGTFGDMNITEYESEDGVFDDPMAVSVYDTIVKAYDFYTDEQNIGVEWKGISGTNDDEAYNAKDAGEVELLVYVHYGFRFENAACGYDKNSGYAIMYVGDGNRNGSIFEQGKARDVIAHEYQHAVTEFAVKGGNGILYLNEGGAISEGVSDIFGALVEGYEPSDERFWNIGEDAVPSGAFLRSIATPTTGYVYHMSDEMPLCYNTRHDHSTANCDSGNTHGNSTILTHAQYRMYQRDPEFFTREIIGKLWFKTLSKIGYRATFASFASAMIEAADELDFPASEKEIVRSCLYERGVIEDENAHVLTFVNEDGVAFEKMSVEDGGKVVAPVMQDRREGDTLYLFDGWVDDEGNAVDTEHVTEDGVLHANYVEKSATHRVTFKIEGNVVADVEVPHGGKAICPIVPNKQSDKTFEYAFEGWDADIDSVEDDLTVNAVFTRTYIPYYVTFRDGDEVIDRREVHFGDTFSDFTLPEKEGFAFDGWLDQNGEPVDSVTVGGDVELVASWKSTSGCAGCGGTSAGGMAMISMLGLVALFWRRR